MSDDKSPELNPLREEEEIQSSESVPEISSQGKEIKTESETDKATVSARESDKQAAGDDDGGGGDGDDGFRTPTSSEHKIPELTNCPPAPKKTRPQSSKLKRKAPSSSPPQDSEAGSRRRILEPDASTEVESIFRPVSSQDSVDDQPKVKKPRMDGHQLNFSSEETSMQIARPGDHHHSRTTSFSLLKT